MNKLYLCRCTRTSTERARARWREIVRMNDDAVAPLTAVMDSHLRQNHKSSPAVGSGSFVVCDPMAAERICRFLALKVYKGNENYSPNFSTAERINRHDELRHHMPQIYQERQDVNGENSHSEDEPDKETGETNTEEGRV